ncbi:GntR family transcriptional regulator [Candidatus Njordibacter sp. Uisw_056]|uniref:GntR family transcriptional regulator n=1 Tax=Candidatus Njordibacter sp. Uisw_056 TaxID=3230973 RepID=UPI003D4DBFF5
MANITEISAGESAYREIRNRIVSLDLKPNQTIGETYLADELGMSRTPIREALTRLSSEGLIDFRSRAGTIVSPIRFDAVISAQYVREKLELAIIEEAVKVKSKRAVFNIRQAIDEQQFAILEGDTAGFFVADERMHRHFSEMTDRVAVWSVISEAKKHMDRVRRLSLQKIDLNVLLSDHLLILEAIENHDVDAARSIVTTHLRRVMHDLDNLAEQHSDYFELAKSEK